MLKKITFSTYPSLLESYKQLCELLGTTMSRQLELLTREYINDSLCSMKELSKHLTDVKDAHTKEKEIKDYKTTISIDENLYEELKEILLPSRVRPASFFTLLMAYVVTTAPTEKLYLEKAMRELIRSDSTITDVVYAVKYYKASGNHELIYTDYFIDACTADRFYERYQKPDIECPYITVKALHKNFIPNDNKN